MSIAKYSLTSVAIAKDKFKASIPAQKRKTIERPEKE